METRLVAPAEWDANIDGLSAAFGWEPAPDDVRELSRASTEWDRAFGVFDDGRLVGGAKAFSREVGLPGGLAPVAAVSAVWVSRDRRRQGVASALMRAQLDDVAAREGLAMLWASEAPIYGHFGYGAAGLRLRHIVRLDGGVRLSAAGERLAAEFGGTFEERPLAGIVGVSGPVLAQVAPEWPGVMTRPEAHERRLAVGDGRVVVARRGGEVTGFAHFTVTGRWDDHYLADGSVEVVELVTVDWPTEAALWRYLLGMDLMGELRAGWRPHPDPLAWMLDNPRVLGSLAADGLWVRVVDVPKALSGRAFSAPLDLVVEVVDAFRPAGSGRWRVVVGAAGERAAVTATPAPADLVLPAGVLGAVHFGTETLCSQAHLVEERTPGALVAASRAWEWHLPVWCPERF